MQRLDHKQFIRLASLQKVSSSLPSLRQFLLILSGYSFSYRQFYLTPPHHPSFGFGASVPGSCIATILRAVTLVDLVLRPSIDLDLGDCGGGLGAEGGTGAGDGSRGREHTSFHALINGITPGIFPHSAQNFPH
jgi:hypothetical protein